MSLVLDWCNTTSLDPINIIGKIGIGFVGVEDLFEVLDSTFHILTLRRSETKDGRILFVCPVRELVVTEFEIFGFVAVVMLVDDSVPIFESLEAHGKL